MNKNNSFQCIDLLVDIEKDILTIKQNICDKSNNIELTPEKVSNAHNEDSPVKQNL